MHIPENYLSPSTCAVATVAMVPIWATAVRKVRESVPREKMPLLGVAAAFCFLSMMFNIPLPGGTTGHAVCGTLIAILFGPWSAVIAVSIALAIQAVFFGDGGILALGANCWHRLVCGPERRRTVRSAGVWHPAPALHRRGGQRPVLPLPHQRSRSGHASGTPHRGGPCRGWLHHGHPVLPAQHRPVVRHKASDDKAVPALALVGALIAATPLGLLATGDAWGEWGLEDLAQMVGYEPAGMATGWEWNSLMPDYAIGSLPEWIGYILSAVIGAALLIIIFRLLVGMAKPEVNFD